MKANIPEVKNKRIVVVGGGFAGLTICLKLLHTNYQIVLLDKHNYHMFQPLFYQVATAGLEPSAISFPYRKVFQSLNNIHIRKTVVEKIDPDQNRVITSIGEIDYDYLILATGATTNFFGNNELQKLTHPMKSVSEALGLRNTILQTFENILISEYPDEQEGMMNFVVVGGGPTGVETSGSLAEMKKYILPKDYPEIDFNRMNIYLVEASPRLLNGMTTKSGEKAYEYLMRMGVKVWLNTAVSDYNGNIVSLSNGMKLKTDNIIWAAGVKANFMEGISTATMTRGNRMKVDQYNKVEGYSNIYALGDLAYMETDKYPNGHPQVAQVAIQSARNVAKNFSSLEKGKPQKPFKYKNLGSMATVGRNLAVVDLPFVHFHGFFAWWVWMFVHLMSILGIKNKVMTFINWSWSYFTYDQSLRLIIKAKNVEKRIIK
ncbi:MAG: NAD(P)/FAD-dependent oxidoreductase [Bacteroidales bacterium]|nr:NAD(P)/FAD-dependent oxidoreductase [Bacteroidales bacterium]